VRKWTAHVDLFSKDFIVLPVNQSLHWSLVIICHMGAAERLLDEHVMDVDADVIDVRLW
jgi:sentrin-specific protease 7